MQNDENKKSCAATPERVPETSPDLRAELLGKLHDAAPEAFAEGRLDLDKLKALLGDAVETKPERYEFNWAGKRDALAMLQAPTRATLIPDPAASVNFDDAQHVFIEGENLEALKVLYRSYFGRVKLIYIDPPYNTGREFIYSDNFADPLDHYLRLTGQTNGSGDYLTSLLEQSGRFHSGWLSMMYPRLSFARQLLRRDGVIFVSIDDTEYVNLKMLMDTVFGEENFLATVIWQKVFSPKNTAQHFSDDHDYILAYARNAEKWAPRLLPRSDAALARYTNPDNDPRGQWSSSDLTARNYYSEGSYEVTSPNGKTFRPVIGTYWRVSRKKFGQLDADKRIWWGESGSNMPRLKRFVSEVKGGVVPQTLWFYKDVGHTQDAKRELIDKVKYAHTENVLNSVKPTGLIKRMLQICTGPDDADIVVDFFAGSNTTTQAIIEQNREDNGNRRVIAVQFPEKLPTPEDNKRTLADVARERVTTVVRSANGNGQGFRVFKLAPSNIRRWTGVEEKKVDTYLAQLEAFTDALAPGWKPDNVIWEVALREGFSLTARIEKITASKGGTYWRVSDLEQERTFTICLDDVLTLDSVQALGLSKNDVFVCRDVALDDTLAANLALQCRLKVI
jgi:adenine-specific DNA-methyltransferase